MTIDYHQEHHHHLIVITIIIVINLLIPDGRGFWEIEKLWNLEAIPSDDQVLIIVLVLVVSVMVVIMIVLTVIMMLFLGLVMVEPIMFSKEAEPSPVIQTKRSPSRKDFTGN